ncbi:helix-turn-helix domain-containing protein [Brachybacterium sp. p3-SID1565]|uniref:Helix-turn-helix domain-containing protein n=1 Tax=Brachybacterium epidermidis TaxID=2781983 RepID=A0ABR9W0B3_9MICO|nr:MULTISPECIES: helix-turn-helix domain-containing protein [Brachybacterium]MBE9403880.1 helix-turn-helix domain-containing protein [Brachybacterium epidermidis]MCT1384498.1 helix-turn-helix domain-containing protein [Brachybacterium sp. p3-SID1565]MCT1775502.1 helix-turn-helix domain-containing protein [Brachybacterium sp. p3-SID957]
MPESAIIPSVHTVETPRAADASGKLLSFVVAHEQRHGTAPSPSFFLTGADEHDRVELSAELFAILKEAATALQRGQSVSIVARDQEVTTQQAAEILGLSRPTVVKLIDAGEIPARIPGKQRRKLRLKDVLCYRDSLHDRRTDFISDTSSEYDQSTQADIAEALREARDRA